MHLELDARLARGLAAIVAYCVSVSTSAGLPSAKLIDAQLVAAIASGMVVKTVTVP